MAKDKDRQLNPAAAQRKAEKQKAVKKGKAAVAAQRTERLATRNPTRLESQISDLHGLRESQGGSLKPRDQKQLQELERDVQRIRKAREVVGVGANEKGGKQEQKEGRERRVGEGNDGSRRRGGYAGLGKRRREGPGASDSEETDEDVRRVPWPRDTPPPIPSLPRPAASTRQALPSQQAAFSNTTRDGQEVPQHVDTSLPPKPTVLAKTTYESKAQVRDLRKEATRAFVPGVVRRKIEAVRGKGPGGKLLEEEEVEALEGEGYRIGGSSKEEGREREGGDGGEGRADAELMNEEEARRLREEEVAFEREIREAVGEDALDHGEGDVKGMQARVEEVSDEDL